MASKAARFALGILLLAYAGLSGATPLSIAKSFGAASIPLNGTTSITFVITNADATPHTNVTFTDNMPAGLVVSPGPSFSMSGCNASSAASFVYGSGVGVTVTGSIAAGGTCTISATVTGTTEGVKVNTTGAVSSTEGGTGSTASATLMVERPPVLTTSFSQSAITPGSNTGLNFVISNPSTNPAALTGVGFTDALPTGLTVPNGSAALCGGTVTLTAPNTISLSGATIPVGSSCNFSVTVTGAIAGDYLNTTSTVTSSNGGTGNTYSASLAVGSPATITTVFGAATIPVNGTTSLTFTVTNPNASVAASGIAFTDNLPAGLVVAAIPGASNTCGGPLTAVAGAGSVSLAGGTLAAGTSCTVSLNVQGTTAGAKSNSVQVTSIFGTGNTSTANITVVAPPTISKAFGISRIPLPASTALNFTLTNPNASVAATGVSFTDNLPAGLVVSSPTINIVNFCGGTLTAVGGATSLSLSGVALAAGASCTLAVPVTSTTEGVKNNTTGAVSSVEGGTGNTASATIKVEAPPSIAMAFSPATIAPGATTSLTFTLTNPATNPDPLTGVAFTDTLPTGLTVSTATATVCGGTLTTTNPTGIALTGATIAVGGQCQFSVTVTGAANGTYTNTTGNVSSISTIGFLGTFFGTNASAQLIVGSSPTISQAFGASTVPSNGTTSLTFTITNPNTSVAASSVAFTDSLPAGLVVAPAPGAGNTCGGTLTATAGAASITLSGGALAPSASCTVSINVQGTTLGAKTNSVTTTSSLGAGNTSTASLTVMTAPTIAMAFGAPTIALNGTTSLTFTIQNPNAAMLTGIAFTDSLPAGLVVATPNGLTGTCGGGTITATQATGTVSLSGASLAANASCTFSVSVVGTSAGTKNNATGAIASVEGGTGGTASASVIVVSGPSLSMAFNPAIVATNAASMLTFTIANASTTTALAGVVFTDTLPAGLTVASATSSVCGGTLTTTAPTGIALSGASIAASGQCQLSVTVTGAANGAYNNTTSAVTSSNGGTGNTASAALNVVSNTFTGPTPSNGMATASFTGGGTTCSYTSAAFIPLTGAPRSPPAGTAPSGYDFPYGLFDFTIAGCTPGSTLTFTIAYRNPLPQDTVYWKYGPTAADATPHWYKLPVTIAGNTATFSITDGGLGDDDLTANGGIVDQGGPGLPFAAAIPVPTLSEWALVVLAGLMAIAGLQASRKLRKA